LSSELAIVLSAAAGVAEVGEIDTEKVLEQHIRLRQLRQSAGEHLGQQIGGWRFGDGAVELAEAIGLQGLQRCFATAVAEAKPQASLTDPKGPGYIHNHQGFGIVPGEIGIGLGHDRKAMLRIQGLARFLRNTTLKDQGQNSLP